MKANWKKVAGRALSFAVGGFLLVFEITGNIPGWWGPVLALGVPIINIVIGAWKPPE